MQRSYKDNIGVANFLSTMGDNGMTFSKNAEGQLISDQTLTTKQASILNSHLDTSWSLGSGNITRDSRDRLVIKDPGSLGNLAWKNAEEAFEEMRVTGNKGNLQNDAWEYKIVKNAKAVNMLAAKNTEAPAEKEKVAIAPATATSKDATPVADAADTTPATAAPAGRPVDTKVKKPVEPEKTNEASPTAAAAPTPQPAITNPASATNTDAASPTPPNAAAPPANPSPTAEANPPTTAAPTPAPEEKKPAPAAPARASAAETKPEDKDTKGDGKSTGGEQKPTTPPDPNKPPEWGDMLSGNSGSILFGVIGGIAGLLLTGGGGIASFLIAGVIALIAAVAGPKIMEWASTPSLDSLDTQGGGVADKTFKANLLDKNKDGLLNAQEQSGVVAKDRESLKKALEDAAAKANSGVTKKDDGTFAITSEADLSYLPAQSLPAGAAPNQQATAPHK